MPWSNGSAGDPSANPPILPVASDTERLRDLFGFKSGDLPLLRSAMNWLLQNNPDGITTVQINLAKAELNLSLSETIYADDDYALIKADVLEFAQGEQATGLEILQQRYKQKIWNTLDLDGYFCQEDYLATGYATSGRS